MFRSIFAFAILALFSIAPAAHATELHIDPIAQVTAIGGVGAANTISASKVDGWKSPSVGLDGTLSARAAGLTVAEATIDNRAGLGHDAIGTGQNSKLSLYTGSESFTQATLTAPGSVTANAQNQTGGAVAAIGGNVQLTIRK